MGEAASVPSGAVGAVLCRCGAGQHPIDTGRCRNGHTWRGSALALVTGARSAQFWQQAVGARHELAAAIIADAGQVEVSAPRALQLAADSIAQAALLQTSAFERLVESGGPFTSSGRTRRAFSVWLSATDRLERHLKLVGLERRAKNLPGPLDYVNQGTAGEQQQ